MSRNGFTLLTFPEHVEKWQKLLPYALLLSVTFAVYGTTLYFDFVMDDHVYIQRNNWITALSMVHLRAIWSNTFLGHYAPVLHTFFAAVYSLSGANPFAYHLVQDVTQAACICCLYLGVQKLESPRIALLTSLLFVLHPTNIETVAYASEVKSTLAFLFFLLSFLAFLKLRSSGNIWYSAACALLLVASILTKINTVVAPAIFVLYDYRERLAVGWRRAWEHVFLFFLAAIFVLIHLVSFFWSNSSLVKGDLSASYYGGLGVHLANLPLMIFFYVRMIFIPHSLTIWHMFPAHSGFDWQVAAGWFGLLAIAWIIYRSDRKIQFWSLWFLVFLAPVLQIVPNLTWVAERYLYIPAIGAFVLLSKLFFFVWEKLQELRLRWSWELAATSILVILFCRTSAYLPVFRNDLSVWGAAAGGCPTSAICHAMLGSALLDGNQVERGMKELIRAVEIRPSPDYLGYLGDAFSLNAGDQQQAIRAYTLALNQSVAPPVREQFYAKLARARLMQGNIEQAGAAIQAAQQINPNDPFLLIVESYFEWKRGNRQAALSAFQKAYYIPGQSLSIPNFINSYWGNPADAGRLSSYLRTEPSQMAQR